MFSSRLLNNKLSELLERATSFVYNDEDIPSFGPSTSKYTITGIIMYTLLMVVNRHSLN